MENSRAAIVLAAALAVLLPSQFAAAEETAEAADSADLAKKLSNPVADLISVPMKLDWNTGIGPANADQDAAAGKCRLERGRVGHRIG